jgi:hypothetical protein
MDGRRQRRQEAFDAIDRALVGGGQKPPCG